MNLLETVGEVLNPFLWAIFISSIGQNVLLNKGLDISQALLIVKTRVRDFFYQGILLTLVMILSTLLLYPINGMIKGWADRHAFVPLIYTIGIIIVYFVVWWIAHRFFPSHLLGFDETFTTAVFNCAILGNLLVILPQNNALFPSIGYALGAGIGYIIACLLLWEGERRMSLSDIPKVFQGLPVRLIYLGILSIAIYGISGIQIYA